MTTTFIRQIITKSEYKRTLKLLHATRVLIGIDAYILMKKILTISMLTDYYQKLNGRTKWIRYDQMLDRNEALMGNGSKATQTIEYIKIVNGLKQHHFFNIKSDLVLLTHNMNIIEDKVLEEWSK